MRHRSELIEAFHDLQKVYAEGEIEKLNATQLRSVWRCLWIGSSKLFCQSYCISPGRFAKFDQASLPNDPICELAIRVYLRRVEQNIAFYGVYHFGMLQNIRAMRKDALFDAWRILGRSVDLYDPVDLYDGDVFEEDNVRIISIKNGEQP